MTHKELKPEIPITQQMEDDDLYDDVLRGLESHDVPDVERAKESLRKLARRLELWRDISKDARDTYLELVRQLGEARSKAEHAEKFRDALEKRMRVRPAPRKGHDEWYIEMPTVSGIGPMPGFCSNFEEQIKEMP